MSDTVVKGYANRVDLGDSNGISRAQPLLCQLEDLLLDIVRAKDSDKSFAPHIMDLGRNIDSYLSQETDEGAKSYLANEMAFRAVTNMGQDGFQGNSRVIMMLMNRDDDTMAANVKTRLGYALHRYQDRHTTQEEVGGVSAILSHALKCNHDLYRKDARFLQSALGFAQYHIGKESADNLASQIMRIQYGMEVKAPSVSSKSRFSRAVRALASVFMRKSLGANEAKDVEHDHHLSICSAPDREVIPNERLYNFTTQLYNQLALTEHLVSQESLKDTRSALKVDEMFEAYGDLYKEMHSGSYNHHVLGSAVQKAAIYVGFFNDVLQKHGNSLGGEEISSLKETKKDIMGYYDMAHARIASGREVERVTDVSALITQVRAHKPRH